MVKVIDLVKDAPLQRSICTRVFRTAQTPTHLPKQTMSEDFSKSPNWIDQIYPVPDPTWDYYRIYEVAIAIDRESTRLFSQISNEEDRTPEADQRIRDRLKEVNLQCNELLRLLG